MKKGFAIIGLLAAVAIGVFLLLGGGQMKDGSIEKVSRGDVVAGVTAAAAMIAVATALVGRFQACSGRDILVVKSSRTRRGTSRR